MLKRLLDNQMSTVNNVLDRIGDMAKKRYFFRNTDVEWLERFLKEGVIFPRGHFISLSEVDDSGLEEMGNDAGLIGDVRIVFNAQKVLDQGGKIVNYVDPSSVEVIEHVTGISRDVCESDEDYEIALREADIQAFMDEKEVVIEKLVLEDDLIESVCLGREDHRKIAHLLRSKEIEYYFNKKSCSVR
jgi:hypothetical protein